MRVRALYNDGRSAVSHRVTVGIDASGLADHERRGAADFDVAGGRA